MNKYTFIISNNPTNTRHGGVGLVYNKYTFIISNNPTNTRHGGVGLVYNKYTFIISNNPTNTRHGGVGLVYNKYTFNTFNNPTNTRHPSLPVFNWPVHFDVLFVIHGYAFTTHYKESAQTSYWPGFQSPVKGNDNQPNKFHMLPLFCSFSLWRTLGKIIWPVF